MPSVLNITALIKHAIKTPIIDTNYYNMCDLLNHTLSQIYLRKNPFLLFFVQTDNY